MSKLQTAAFRQAAKFRHNIDLEFRIRSGLAAHINSEEIEDAIAQTMWNMGFQGQIINLNGNETAIRDFEAEKKEQEITDYGEN